MAAGQKNPEEKKTDTPGTTDSLRDDAEEHLARSQKSSSDLKGQTPEELIHELQVHQVELETQAEELRRTHLVQEELKDKYLDLYDFAPLGYLTLNDKALVTGVNLTGATLLGANRKDIINHGLGRFIAPVDLEIWNRYFAKVRQHENKQVCTLTLLREDNVVFPARLEGVRTTSNDGTIAFRFAISDITDISEAGRALQESEEKYKTLIDTLNEGIWVIDKNAVTTFVNPKMAMILGYTVSDMTGRSLFSFMDEDGRRVCEQNLERRQQGIKEQHDFEFLKKDGVRIYASLEATPIKGKNGEYLGAIAGVTDITERKRVEDALRKSEHIVSSILESTPNLIYIYDLNEHRNVFANKEIVDFLGYSGEQILSLGPALFENLLHPKDVQTVAQHHARMKTSVEGEVFECEYRMKHANGTWRFLRSRDMAFLRDQTGEVKQILGSAEDITERKWVEEVLRESHDRFEQVSGQSREMVWEVDTEGLYTYVSPASYAILGYQPNELIGKKHFYDLHPEEGRESFIASTFEVFSRKLLFCEHLNFAQAKNGQIICLSTSGMPVLDNKNNLIGYRGSDSDITDRKRAEDKLRHVTRLYALHSQINQAIVRILEQDELFRTICQVAIEFGQFRMAWIGLTDDAGETIKPVAHAGHEDGYLDEIVITTGEMPTGKGPTGSAFREGDVVTSDDIATDSRMLPWKDEALKRGYRSSAAVPLRCMGKTIGTLNLYSTEPGFFTADERDLVQKIGDDISFALDAMTSETERKRTEEALHESARYTRNLIEVSLDPLVTISPEGKITDVNAATERVTGYSRNYLVGTDFSNYFTDLERAREGYRKVFNDGVVRDYPLEIRHRDGTITSVLYNASIYRDETGTVQGVFAAARDITDRKRAEEALLQANKKLNLLSSITRHDINNQLTVLMGFLSILKMKQADTTLNEYFQKVSTAAKRISPMVQFTKEYEEIGVHAPAWQDTRTLVDTSATQAPLGKVIVMNDIPSGAEMFADPLIVKVLYNLMDNAVRYGGKITNIRFSVEECDGDHIVVCEDDGDGVVAEDKEKIFERGFGKNTGLGLALAREILSITGITITETGDPGKGARFEMEVPEGMWRMAGKGD